MSFATDWLNENGITLPGRFDLLEMAVAGVLVLMAASVMQ